MVVPLENCRWMYNRINPDTRTIIEEFIFEVDEFMSFACQSSIYLIEGTIRCPCVKCCSRKLLNPKTIEVLLYKKGFQPDYWHWTDHREETENFPETEEETEAMQPEVSQMSGGIDEGEGGARLTRNLIMPLEMAFNNAMPGSPQVTVPAHECQARWKCVIIKKAVRQ